MVSIDLKVPPGNRLHALAGELRGCHAAKDENMARWLEDAERRRG